MIQSVDRAIKLLNAVAKNGDWIGVRELARATGLKAPTCQHLLKTLQANGYLEFDENTRRYRVGLAVVRLTESIDPIRRMGDFTSPQIDRLFADFNETIAVLALYHGKAVVVDWRQGDHPLSTHQPHRVIEQPHTMASGRVLIAFQDDDFIRRYADTEFETDLGINIPNSKEELLAELEMIRKQGYSVVINARDAGIGAYAAPVFDATGRLVMAIACSAPLSRFDEKKQEEIFGRLMHACNEMTASLGGRPIKDGDTSLAGELIC